ncbi:MAG: 23S rRNA (adenine(2030)-N(6))-methyltransferase RlmJ [Candidatus Competibacterales bacterium]|nr:23S rRNA (adenine(2030)-N(6))-methyltransferase RlmJ [Candidatus Competibacterales bacterium]
MLSYQHLYHAGNFADVHKHLALLLILQALQRKPAGLQVLDTHAGSGCYDLDAARALKTEEFRDGIARLWSSPEPALADYLARVRAENPDGRLRVYPGSPLLVQSLLRTQDRLALCELHPGEYGALRRLMAGDSRVAVHRRDGFEALGALLPPRLTRGLVLIDPSYERKHEYDRVAASLIGACRRWPQGVYLAWYPLLAAGRHRHLLRTLQRSGLRAILVSELCVFRPDEAPGLYGSGLVLVHPPWQLDRTLGALTEGLARCLARGTPRAHTDWLVAE